MANDLSEQKLKQPDEFESLFGRLLGFMVRQRSRSLMILATLVVASIALVLWNSRMERKNQEAAQRWAGVLEGFPKDQASRAEWEKFLGDVDQFLAERSETSLVPAVKLHRGKALLSLARYSDAIPTYQEAAKALPKPTRYLAEEGEAFALMELKRWDEAETIWARLSKAEDNPTRAFHMWNLGLTQEAATRIGPALQTYQEFETTYPDSNLIEQVRSRLSALRSTAPKS